MDVAGAKLDRLFEKVVDCTNHRRAAREIAQALDIIFPWLRSDIGGCINLAIVQPPIENEREILRGRNLDRQAGPKHNLLGTQRRLIGRVGDGQDRPAIRRAIGKYNGLAQEALRKRRH